MAEPAGAHSVDCVWKASYFCFNCGKNCCYNILAALCGIFIALGWGCEFAWITFSMVWCITPCLRLYSILMGCLQKYFGTCITCFLAPICETCGLLFSRITVSNVKWKTGIFPSSVTLSWLYGHGSLLLLIPNEALKCWINFQTVIDCLLKYLNWFWSVFLQNIIHACWRKKYP